MTDAAGNSASCQTTYTVSSGIGLLNPPNYSVAFAPATISFEAAVNPMAQVQMVRFRANGAVVAESSTAPHRATVNFDVPGLYSLQAEALSPDGASREFSEARVLTILDPAGGVPSPLVPRAPTILNLVNEEGQFSFWIATQPGVTAYVEFTDDLTAPQWKVLKVIVGDGFPVESTVPVSRPQTFFRIRVP